MVEDFSSLENFGINTPKQALFSSDMKRSMDILKATTKIIQDRYEVGLLWKHDSVQLPDNYWMALSRFESLEIQLKSRPDLRKIVMEQMRE